MKYLLLVLSFILIVTGCGNKEKNNLRDQNNSINNNLDNIENVTNINANIKYSEEKKVDEIKFYSASLVKVGETSLFEVNVKNESIEDINIDHIKISLLTKDGIEIVNLEGLVPNGILKSDVEHTISSYYNGKIEDVYSVNYEVVM